MTEANRGDRLAGRYLLVRRLGRAEPESPVARAQAWVAEDRDGTRVVLKLHPDPTAARREADAIAAFARAAAAEPEAAAGLVRVLDVVEIDPGRSALVLEYLPGGDLASRRGRRWTDLLPPLVPALAALARAHAAGLAHGDLKSANLVLGEDGRARLVDFGTAALEAAPGRPTGSPLTRSPAQWRGAAPGPADDAYALGATLHELLTGFPPFYPDVTAARVEREPVVELHPRHSVPEPLVRLVLGLLAKEPDARPTVADVRATLEPLLAGAADAPEAAVPLVRPPTPTFAVVPPPGAARVGAGGAGGAMQGATGGDVPSAGAAEEPTAPRAWQPGTTSGPAPTRGTGRSSRWPLAVGGVLVAAAVGVFFALPRWVAEREPAATAGVTGTGEAIAPGASAAPGAAGTRAGGAARAPGNGANAAAGGPAELPSDPAALAELARAKTEAEEVRDRFREAAADLAKQRAEVWGGEPYARFTRLGEDATRAYEARDYAAAGKAWTAGAALAAEVAKARAPALATALAAGRDALARGDSRAATAAFDRALAIEPGQREAAAGRTRAARLDEVLALLDAGGERERAGDAAGAREKYRAALAIDAQAAAATAGLARLEARARADTLAATIAQGQRALAAGRRTEARAAFERARALDPRSPAVADALAQLDANDRTARLSNLQAEAEAAERAERWADAVKAYSAALAIDPTVRYAQDGHARAKPRAELAARLDGYLRDPERLASADGRADARDALRAAAAVRDAGPQLQGQARSLESLVLGYETPVRVALASDNLTEVLVYRVGRLGAFESRELQLLPGRYTVVGRRPGFRDVRREVVVAPGDGAAVDIRCTEPI